VNGRLDWIDAMLVVPPEPDTPAIREAPATSKL